MLELTPVMAQKVILKITNHPYTKSSLSLIESLYGIIFEYIRTQYHIEPDWSRFCSYCQCEYPDNQVKLNTASIYPDESAQYPYLWALRIKTRDNLTKRRNWTTHIGIKQESENKATIYFAELYYDHIAGSFSPMRPPTVKTPAFIDQLLFSGRLLCMSGAYPIPPQAIPLVDQSTAELIPFLFDSERFIPTAIITCPDLINPNDLWEATKGNLAVFWVDDYALLESINAQLPAELRIEWDSTRIFLPFSEDTRFHPSFSAQDIARVGGKQLIESIRQAYCVGLRADDRRAFVTVDSILSQRDSRSSTTIQARLASNAADLTRLREENRQLSENCAALSAQINTSARHDQQAEIAEYESLLSETMAETDQIKRGVSLISERLYANMGKEFSPDDSESNPQLCELQHAIYSCFVRLSNRK